MSSVAENVFIRLKVAMLLFRMCVYPVHFTFKPLNSANLQTYKRTPIHFYDPHKAPLLDHYRSVLFAVLLTSLNCVAD